MNLAVNLSSRIRTVNPGNPGSCYQYQYSKNENHSHIGAIQLGLFEPKRSEDLILAPVPKNLALEPDRFYIRLGDWYAGIQLTRTQAYKAIERIGRNRERDVIWSAIESVVDGGVA